MNTSKKTTIFFLIIVVLIIALGYFYWPKIMSTFSKRTTTNMPVYSENVTESKSKLVPSDFPFPADIKNSKEFQSSMNNLFDYTNVWESATTLSENKEIFEKYMKDNGWNPFSIVLDADSISLTGQKDKVVLNINLHNTRNKNLTTKVEVHFSQSNK